MHPYIHTSFGDLSTFTIFIVVGAISMIFMIHFTLKKSNQHIEETFIYPRLVISGILGFVFAAIFDLLFKYLEYGIFKIYGITFYGGLIGACVVMYVLLKISKSETQYNISEWFEILTPPFIVFHFFGRLGCFFAGCCYGRNSDSVFALAFPDNEKMGIFHNGQKCYPTQLFEALALVVILIFVMLAKKKFQTYLMCYALVRFNLEFLRGDDRGFFTNQISPSQIISIVIICGFILYKLIIFLKNRRNVNYKIT